MAIFGKWHLGQRPIYLPGNHGFDYYLGIPFSDDMGDGVASSCQNDNVGNQEELNANKRQIGKGGWSSCEQYRDYDESVISNQTCQATLDDPAGHWLPLVHQIHNKTTILEQPLDFTTLAEKYSAFATDFIDKHATQPFFLYAPFSHVHTTSATQPEKQFSGCSYQNKTKRGSFGNALAELDGIVGAIVNKLTSLDLMEDTLIILAADNGPWVEQGLSAGSAGLLTGQYADYTNTAKGSTWEGGIRVPSFVHWKGVIPPYSRSSEVLSSLDVFPTLSALAGIDGLPTGRKWMERIIHYCGWMIPTKLPLNMNFYFIMGHVIWTKIRMNPHQWGLVRFDIESISPTFAPVLDWVEIST